MQTFNNEQNVLIDGSGYPHWGVAVTDISVYATLSYVTLSAVNIKDILWLKTGKSGCDLFVQDKKGNILYAFYGCIFEHWEIKNITVYNSDHSGAIEYNLILKCTLVDSLLDGE